MKKSEVSLPMPLLGAVGATRGLLGLGIGLLVADRLEKDHRRILGLTLVGVGVATTIPLALTVFRRRKAADTAASQPAPSEPRMVH